MSEENQEESAEDTLKGLSEKIQREAMPTDPFGEKMTAILTKWVLVAEWHDDKGNVWLTRRFSTGSGGSLALWDMKGMLHEALFGDIWGGRR